MRKKKKATPEAGDTQSKFARFIIEIPPEVNQTLRKEAEREQRSRKAQVQRILEERYGFAPQTSAEVSAA